LIDHANALNKVFPVARQHGVRFVVGSSLNAGFISGSARYNYGKTRWNIPPEHLAKARETTRRCQPVRRRPADGCAAILGGAGRCCGTDRGRAY
jgi:aryl-alcohol dehydrogenase-like predicted oxidoreductase